MSSILNPNHFPSNLHVLIRPSRMETEHSCPLVSINVAAAVKSPVTIKHLKPCPRHWTLITLQMIANKDESVCINVQLIINIKPLWYTDIMEYVLFITNTSAATKPTSTSQSVIVLFLARKAELRSSLKLLVTLLWTNLFKQSIQGQLVYQYVLYNYVSTDQELKQGKTQQNPYVLSHSTLSQACSVTKSLFTFCLASIFLAQLLCAHFSLTSAFSQALLTYFWRALRNNQML